MLEFRAQRLGRDLGRDADLAGRGIGSHKLHFVDPDRALLLSPKVFLISLTTSWALDPPRANARTSWTNSSLVTWFEKWMLARPAVVSS